MRGEQAQGVMMSIRVICPGCETSLNAPEKAIGRTSKCPKCSSQVVIAAATDTKPSPSPAPSNATKAKSPPRAAAKAEAPQAARLTIDRLLSEFHGPIDRVRRTLLYRVSILVSFVTMLLMPLVYLCIIAATCYVVYYHTMHHGAIVTSVRGRGAIIALAIYLAPIVAGVIVILFMFKPLFARPVRDERTRSLKRESEPVLFAFVDKICETVRAPKPRRIDVDCQVNASASFRSGLWSMLGNDLVLTIGMPLIAGLSAREFGGVLAHEFGHFSQGVGMRLTYIVRSISHWMVRVVYGRDRWDQWLEETASSVDFRIGIVLYVAMLAVWLTRKILWVLLHLGLMVAGFTLRQMEFDADRHETRFAGSDTFASTAKRLQQLGAGMQMAQRQLGESHREGRLVDDLPTLIKLNASRLPERAQQAIDEQLRIGQTGWFDTHPCDRDRIAASAAEQAEGVFTLDMPATALFADFAAQSKATTFELYRGLFGNKLDRSSLQPVGELMATEDQHQEQFERLAGYSLQSIRPFRPLKFTSSFLNAPDKPQQVVARLKAARDAMQAGAESTRQSLNTYDECESRLAQAGTAQALIEARVRLPKDALDDQLRTLDGARRVQQQMRRRLGAINGELQHADQALTDRLTAALELMNVNQIASRVDAKGKLRKRTHGLLATLIAIDGQLETINQLAKEQARLGALVHIASQGADENLVSAIDAIVGRLYPKLEQVREVLSRSPYPFKTNPPDRTLGNFVLPSQPHRRDLGGVVDALPEMLDRILNTRLQILAELASHAESVERVLKLAPLVDPTTEGDISTAAGTAQAGA